MNALPNAVNALPNGIALQGIMLRSTIYLQRIKTRIVSGDARCNDLSKIFVHNCLSHEMRAAKNTVRKYYGKKHNFVAMYWISFLFSCNTLDQLDRIMDGIIYITNCKMSSSDVKEHFEHLKHHDKDGILTRHCQTLEVDNNDEHKESDYFCNRTDDRKQELNSKFYLRYLGQVADFRSSDAYAKHNVQHQTVVEKNPYYGEEFCDQLIRIRFPVEKKFGYHTTKVYFTIAHIEMPDGAR